MCGYIETVFRGSKIVAVNGHVVTWYCCLSSSMVFVWTWKLVFGN